MKKGGQAAHLMGREEGKGIREKEWLLISNPYSLIPFLNKPSLVAPD